MPKRYRRLFHGKRPETLPRIVEKVYLESRGATKPNANAIFALSDKLVERTLKPTAEGLGNAKELGQQKARIMYFNGERTVKGGKLPLASVVQLTDKILEWLPGYIKRNEAKINPQFRQSLAELEARLPKEYLELMVSLGKHLKRESELMPVSDGIIQLAQILNDEAMAHVMGQEHFEKYAREFDEARTLLIRRHAQNQ